MIISTKTLDALKKLKTSKTINKEDKQYISSYIDELEGNCNHDLVNRLIDTIYTLNNAVNKACEILADNNNEIYEIDDEDEFRVLLTKVNRLEKEWKEYLLNETN